MKLSFGPNFTVLAPLAGYTDLPFRSVVKKFGVDLTVSEMISSNALAYASKKTKKLAEKSERETPYSVQIAGYKEDVVKRAVEVLNDMEGIDIIDLNCGCPAPKVVGNNSGSGLLKDLPQMSRLIETIKKTSNKEYTSCKIRLGFEGKHGVEIAKICEDSGADFIAVHGRTRAMKFGGEVDYDAIAEIKAAVNIPVIANGDITSFEKAKYVSELTKCDGIMIGRAAIGNPWIFYQIKHGRAEVPSELKREIILEHFDEMVNFHGERGVIMFRKHLHTYSKGIEGAASFRVLVNKIADPRLMREHIREFFSI
ncbi:MAG: tRNA-dihydrouridine synthase [Campylobacteraceae bacterium]|jgi:tRNA-dihydrouridine synthase B|nr:tRNA-dihydrouridine synthase [Campylobacteraceae bacterium]